MTMGIPARHRGPREPYGRARPGWALVEAAVCQLPANVSELIPRPHAHGQGHCTGATGAETNGAARKWTERAGAGAGGRKLGLRHWKRNGLRGATLVSHLVAGAFRPRFRHSWHSLSLWWPGAPRWRSASAFYVLRQGIAACCYPTPCNVLAAIGARWTALPRHTTIFHLTR